MTKRIQEKELFKTPLFTIKDLDVQLDNGKIVQRQILEKANTSLIVPLTHDGHIIYIREYGAALDMYQLDLPGGRIDPDTSPEETAQKELQEEIGYKAGKLDKLGELCMSPGYLTQMTYIYLARDLSKSKLIGDEEEELEIIEYPFESFEELIKKQKITEARAIAALYLTRTFLLENT